MEAEKGGVGPKTQAGITTSNEAGVMRGGVEKEAKDPEKKAGSCIQLGFLSVSGNSGNMAKVHKMFINKIMTYRKKEKDYVERL